MTGGGGMEIVPEKIGIRVYGRITLRRVADVRETVPSRIRCHVQEEPPNVETVELDIDSLSGERADRGIERRVQLRTVIR